MGYFINKIRTFFWTAFYYIFKPFFFSELGDGCRFEGWIDMPQKGGRIALGKHVHVCRQVEFSVTQNASFVIADNVYIGRGVIVSAHAYIEIGARTLLAEYVCLHDNNHIFDNIRQPIINQGFSTQKILIGSDCWIGAHSILVKGAAMDSNVIIGANSLVKSRISQYTVAAGAPAKALYSRA